MKKIIKLINILSIKKAAFTFSIFFFLLNTIICQKIHLIDKRVSIGAVWSKVNIDRAGYEDTTSQYPYASYYYRTNIPVWGIETNLLSSIKLWRGLKAELGTGYRLNGFGTRHFVRTDSTSSPDAQFDKYRYEDWSKFYFHNLKLSAGIGYDFKDIARIKFQITSQIPVFIQEQRKSVRLSESFYRGTEIIGTTKHRPNK